MRKSLYISLLLIVLMLVLVGCISIPLDNKGGVIKISAGGIKYSQGTEEENATEEIKIEVNENEEEEEKEERFYSKKDAEQTNDTEAEADIEDEYVCEDDDYTEFTQHLGADIYIPSCSILTHVTPIGGGIEGWFLVDHYDYDTVLKNYRAFLGPFREERLDTEPYAASGHSNIKRQIAINGTLANGRKVHVVLGEYPAHVLLMINYK